MKDVRILLLFVMLVVAACNKDINYNNPINLNEHKEHRHITQDEAIASLKNFINKASNTKLAFEKRIASIVEYYPDATLTKSGNSVVDTDEPLAYLVNFENEGGFAVLGATSALADVIVVTESGSINNDLTVNLGVDSEEIIDVEDNEDCDFDEVPENYYCVEDQDYYSASNHTELLEELIRNGLEPKDDVDDHPELENFNNEYWDTGIPAYSFVYTTRSPILTTNWSQEDKQLTKYCKNKKGKKRYAGCSNIALSMILTANMFPTNLYVNNRLLDWKGMQRVKYGPMEPSSASEDISFLTAAILRSVPKLYEDKNCTLITPKQIQKMMKRLGYTNVIKHDAGCLTNNMIKSISEMLANNKPVFMSAIPINFWKAHSWVVDGAKYSADNNYLFHINFGWGGLCNGYFSTTCLSPSKAYEHDYPFYDNGGNNYTYRFHFRVITYDIPQAHTECKLFVNF